MRPVARTPRAVLNLPATYPSFPLFREEWNSTLSSEYWVLRVLGHCLNSHLNLHTRTALLLCISESLAVLNQAEFYTIDCNWCDYTTSELLNGCFSFIQRKLRYYYRYYFQYLFKLNEIIIKGSFGDFFRVIISVIASRFERN